MLLEFVQFLTEGARTPHPEDFIFSGSADALNAVKGMVTAVRTPNAVSIKWDGSPAIIFGRRTVDGKFTMNYKEYIAEPGGQVTSAEELYDYFVKNQKNVIVGQKLASVFNSIASTVPQGFQGFILGDLMWTEPLALEKGKYVFQANPHGVTYAIDAGSAIGKQIAGRQVGIAIHTYGSDVEKSRETPLVNKQPLHGYGGLTPTKYATILTSTAGETFRLVEPVQLVKAAENTIKKYGTIVDSFLSSLTGASKSTLQTYYNKKITQQPVDAEWLRSKLSSKQFEIVNAEDNRPALEGLNAIWTSIYQLKMALLDQLEPQVRGVEQYVGGQPKGEGFVINTPSGIIKLVNRGVFSAANFAGRML